VRLGLILPAGREPRAARLAEDHGLFGVLVEGGQPGHETVVAGQVAAVTEAIRLVVRVPLGSEHPVTLAEELAVLDNASAGRVVVLADSAGLDAAAAAEDLEVLRRSWAGRPLRHAGRRWRVPAGLDGHAALEAVSVTPKPAQVDLPVWLGGAAAAALATATGLAPVVTDPADARPQRLVQPAAARLAGDLEADRAAVLAWAGAGATHLLLRLPDGAALDAAVAVVSRHIAPEAAMPHFPRVLAEG
jgi:alkanesulfonate monooxygenase SsuD/methylene tetrahydromethanopterin reductase-like flavin-dependent oxidoreductase (luciferase family)